MKKAFINQKSCVACGCCLTACKIGAISIFHGVHAVVNTEKCVGCGMCAQKCPASIITVKESFSMLGGRFGLSRKKNMPRWMVSSWFRYGFLIFFLTMFGVMIWNTYLVFAGADLKQVVTLLWVFKLPWHWAYHGTFFSSGVAQFAFGFYSIMLTSTLLGLVTMVLFKPRSWCVYCPMGTMTQMICKIKAHNK